MLDQYAKELAQIARAWSGFFKSVPEYCIAVCASVSYWSVLKPPVWARVAEESIIAARLSGCCEIASSYTVKAWVKAQREGGRHRHQSGHHATHKGEELAARHLKGGAPICGQLYPPGELQEAEDQRHKDEGRTRGRCRCCMLVGSV
eukprot:scaffold73953_cov32-Tisochrysis_lutea.AAC.12